MGSLLESAFVYLFNSLRHPVGAAGRGGLHVGFKVIDGQITTRPFLLAWVWLVTHVWIFGVTGVGKSKLIQHIWKLAFYRNIPAIINALHSDLPPFVLGTVAEREQRTGQDFSGKFVPFTFTDRQYAPGLNLLAVEDPVMRFVMAAELAEALRLRWHLQDLGPRTAELARNSFVALSDAGLTLLELPLFLTDRSMRARVLQKCSNSSVREYFEFHYDQLSEAQQAIYRAPLLNKLSELISDPAIAHCIGQIQWSLMFRQALDDRITMLVMTEKSRLGEQALTLAALLAILEKNAVFARQKHHLALLVFDEAQNFVRMQGGVLETLLSESRKANCGVIVAHQSIEQLDSETRAALLGTGIQVFFRLGASDAERVASYLGGGKNLAERLRNLPRQHAIVKTAATPPQEIVIADVSEPAASFADLYNRCRERWMRPRAEMAAELAQRHEDLHQNGQEELHDWD